MSDEEAYSYLSINQFYFFLSIYITSFGCNEQAFNELSKYAKMVIHNMNSSDGCHEHFMAMFYYLIHLEDQINSDPEYDCADELRFIYFKALELQDKEDIVSRITFFRAYYRIVATAKFNINIDIDASWLINAYDQITDVNEKNNWFEAATYAKHALFGESKFQEALDLEIKLMEVIKNDKDIDPVFLNNPDSRPGDAFYVFVLANLERYQEAKEAVDNLINRDGLDIDTYLTYFKMGLSLYAGRQDKEGFLDYVADKSLDVNRFLNDPLFIGKFFGAALELCISGMPLETFKEFEESFEQFLFGHFEDNPYMLLRLVHAMFHTNNLLDVDNNELQLFINTRMLFSYCYYLNHGEKDWIDSNFIYAVNEAADLGFDAIEDGLDYKVFALLCFSAYYTLIQQRPDLLGEKENERFIQASRLRLRVETDPNKLKILADLIDQYE